MGDAAGVLGFVNTLKSQVINLGWDSKSNTSRKANAMYDKETGQYASYIIEKRFSSKTVLGGICTAKEYSLELDITFRTMTAGNAAAKKICQGLMNNAAGDFLQLVELEKVFKQVDFKPLENDASIAVKDVKVKKASTPCCTLL